MSKNEGEGEGEGEDTRRVLHPHPHPQFFLHVLLYNVQRHLYLRSKFARRIFQVIINWMKF
jgi:hypothetical protein